MVCVKYWPSGDKSTIRAILFLGLAKQAAELAAPGLAAAFPPAQLDVRSGLGQRGEKGHF